MFFHIGFSLLCLTRISVGEPPVAPYPAAGPPSGPSFFQGQGGSSQNQDLPEILEGRSNNYNEQANHRIHFNLFKDHETKKTKDNLSFKLGQGDGQFGNGGDQNIGQNFQKTPGNRYSSSENKEFSQRYGSPQNALNRNYGAPNFNQQSSDFGRQNNNDLSSNYGAPRQNGRQEGGLSTRYGPPQQNFDQARHFSAQQDYQTDFRASSSQARQQGSTSPQGYQTKLQQQYGPPQSQSSNLFSNLNQPSNAYGPPRSAGSVGKSSFQQLSSNYGAPKQNYQQNLQLSQAYGAPHQGQQYKKMDQYQQRSHQFNPLDKQNNFQRQDAGSQRSHFGDGKSSEHMTDRANYEFEYEVRGDQSHGHEESREGDEAWGSYRVQLPDGRTMLVEYTADDRGYRPKITYTDQSEQQQY